MNEIITQYDQERWPLLEVPSQECKLPLNEYELEQVKRMDSILTELGDNAAGLAAVQIGYPKRIFMLRRNEENELYINPKIIARSNELKMSGEACLSLPGMYVRSRRPKFVSLSWTNLDGSEQVETFNGFWARAVCHEMDHLDGKLIINDLQKEMNKASQKMSFGMVIDESSRKRISDRRAKNKRAKAARKLNRG